MGEPRKDPGAEAITAENQLRRMAPDLPGPIRYRLLNALDHHDRAARLFDTDRAMASFRAITGEEEAATTLITAIRLRKYPGAEKFLPRDHVHKAGVIACVMAMAAALNPVLAEFQITFDFQRKRIDVMIPMATFGGPADLGIQLVEPLDLIQGANDGSLSPIQVFEETLAKLADKQNFASILLFVKEQANARNKLLYASDSAVPHSAATLQGLENRKARTATMLVLSVMIMQTRQHQALVTSAIGAFLSVILRLPAIQNDG